MRPLLLVCLVSSALARPPAPVVEDKAPDRFVPAAYDAQRIEGYLGQRMKMNLEGRLLNIDEEKLLAGFEHRPGEQAWIGEHVGKYLDAAANTWLATKDDRLRAQMERVVDRLLKTQLPDGYLGTYRDQDRWTEWDVWVHKYDLIGLLAWYRATGDERALEASKKIGDLLDRTFGDGKRDITASSTHFGMAATSVLEPMVQLYRYTGERRYLDFAEYLVRSWGQDNGPKLLSTLEAQGRVDKVANGKAYEMMSDLVGLVELHRVTGNPRYRRVAEIAWLDIAMRRLFVTGTVSNHEHFQPDHIFPGEPSDEVGEGCATVTWLQLSWQLLRLTGEAAYAEELERTVFNALLGAQDPSTGDVCYFTPLNGKKRPTPGVNCCVSSVPRGISMIPALSWGVLNGAVAIELYTPGVLGVKLARAGEVGLQALSDFPDDGKIVYTVTTENPAPFAITLRVPGWTTKFQARVGKERWTGRPGSYLTIERAWQKGDRLQVEMDLTVRVLGSISYEGFAAFVRGVQVLALDRHANSPEDVPYLWRTAVRSPRADALLDADSTFALKGRALDSEGVVQDVFLMLLPFADSSEQRIWLARGSEPKKDPVPVTAYGRESLSSSDPAAIGSITDDRSETWRATRTTAAAAEDWYAVEMDQPHTLSRIVFQHGPVTPAGGAFAEPPRIEIRAPGAKEWTRVAAIENYQPRSFARYSQDLPTPVEVIAIRVAGKRAAGFTTCAELAGYESR